MKVRISCDVTRKLRQHLDARAKENGISRAKFIETAVEDKIEGFNVHKENKRLTQAHAQAERDIFAEEQRAAKLKDERDGLASEKEQLTVKHIDRIKEIASALGVPDTIGHIKQRIAELNYKCELVNSTHTLKRGACASSR